MAKPATLRASAAAPPSGGRPAALNCSVPTPRPIRLARRSTRRGCNRVTLSDQIEHAIATGVGVRRYNQDATPSCWRPAKSTSSSATSPLPRCRRHGRARGGRESQRAGRRRHPTPFSSTPSKGQRWPSARRSSRPTPASTPRPTRPRIRGHGHHHDGLLLGPGRRLGRPRRAGPTAFATAASTN